MANCPGGKAVREGVGILITFPHFSASGLVCFRETKHIVIGCLVLVFLGLIVAGIVGGILLLGLNGFVDKTENEGLEFGRQTNQGPSSNAKRKASGMTLAASMYLSKCLMWASERPGTNDPIQNAGGELMRQQYGQAKITHFGTAFSDTSELGTT